MSRLARTQTVIKSNGMTHSSSPTVIPPGRVVNGHLLHDQVEGPVSGWVKVERQWAAGEGALEGNRPVIQPTSTLSEPIEELNPVRRYPNRLSEVT